MPLKENKRQKLKVKAFFIIFLQIYFKVGYNFALAKQPHKIKLFIS
ncbi:hypothetical protein HMPREF1870_00262 [Bacteroidales bacterium KA00344]|nr:hypothetical protein HMPREF1870_00262 [Bacteroidales bacterium KA00344]